MTGSLLERTTSIRQLDPFSKVCESLHFADRVPLMPFLLACGLVRGSPFLRTANNIVYRPMRRCGLHESSVMIYGTTHLFPTAIKCTKISSHRARAQRDKRFEIGHKLDARRSRAAKD
jgi:hypothetical protein